MSYWKEGFPWSGCLPEDMAAPFILGELWGIKKMKKKIMIVDFPLEGK
jgi:hypothetical protein